MAYIQGSRNLLRQIITGTRLQSVDHLLNPLFYAGQGVRYKRKLGVILTTSVPKLGKAGETVKVAPGYFRNYLMPKLLAVPNIDKFAYLMKGHLKIPEAQKEDVEKVAVRDEDDLMKEYETAAKRMFSRRVVLKRFSLVDGELRDPVTKDEILSEVARQLWVRIEPENLHLPSPLTRFGVFELPLRLPKSIPLPEGQHQWLLRIKIRRKPSKRSSARGIVSVGPRH